MISLFPVCREHVGAMHESPLTCLAIPRSLRTILAIAHSRQQQDQNTTDMKTKACDRVRLLQNDTGRPKSKRRGRFFGYLVLLRGRTSWRDITSKA